MRLLFIFFCLVFSFATAQTQRFFYEYRFKTDSTSKDSMATEMMVLDVSRKGSKFSSFVSMKADSVMAARQKNNPDAPDFSGIKFGTMLSTTEKKYPDFEIHNFEFLGPDYYEVQDSRKLDWQIVNEKAKIGNYSVQKATLEQYGRNWIAWFTPEIPFQDGPYKFHGLPGLILKISDESQTHVFEWKATVTLKDDWLETSKKHTFSEIIPVNEKQFKKAFVENRNNPTKAIRQMIVSGTPVMITDENGKQVDIEAHLREREKSVKEENARNNNILELELLK